MSGRGALPNRYANEEIGKALRPLLGDGVREMRAQIAMHDGAGAAYHAMGARASCSEAVQQLPRRKLRKKMRQRRETVEHPFGTIKARMGATHFLMKTLPRLPPRWRCTCSATISRAS